MIRTLTLSAAVAMLAGTALADPCEAPVTGYRPGQVISAPIIHSIDGDGLCLALGRHPSDWLEIRESQFYAPELNTPEGRRAKRVMDSLIGKRAVCTVERGKNGATRSYDRVIAACRVDGAPIAVRMRAAGITPGGRGR